jgi:hypothetical protein
VTVPDSAGASPKTKSAVPVVPSDAENVSWPLPAAFEKPTTQAARSAPATAASAFRSTASQTLGAAMVAGPFVAADGVGLATAAVVVAVVEARA